MVAVCANISLTQPYSLSARNSQPVSSSSFYGDLTVESANPAVKALLDGSAPRPAQVAASRAILPLPQNDLFEVLVTLARSEDTELAGNAGHTLTLMDERLLEESVRSDEIASSVLLYISQRDGLNYKVYEGLLVNPKTPPKAVVTLATITTSAPVLDLISLNQQLLIQTPAIIEAILANTNRSMEAARRAAEETDVPSERISIINRIMKMGMKDRAKLAMKGDREARNILIRDPNRVVAQAVVKNPN